MTDPNLPHDPRFSPPPSAPMQPPVPPVQPHALQPTQPPILQAATFDGASVHDQIEKKASIGGRLGLVAAALVVAGGGAFAVTRALTEPTGAQTPEEAVAQLFEAVENDDLIGLTEAMLPSEREALIDPMIDLFSELERLEILDEDVDLEARTDEAGSDGIDFSVSGLDYVTDVVGEGVVNVRLTAGVVSVTGDVSDLPFGDRAAAEIGEQNMSESLDEEIVDFADEEDARFTVVEEDGSWYVSLWYSAAEAIREEVGEPAPNFGGGVVPAGGETPEEALRTMMEAAVELDAEGVVAAMDPSEFRALYDYAPLFLADADEAAADFRQMLADENVTYSLDRLDLSSSDVRGRTVVSVDGFAASATSSDERFSLDFDGNCFTVIVNSEIDETCLDEFRDEIAEQEVPDVYLDLVTGSNSGVTVVQRDGSWFVSGFPTMIGAYTDLLASLEPRDIDDLADFFSSSFGDAFDIADPLFDELTGSSSSREHFGEVPEAIEEDFDEEDGYDPFAEEEGSDFVEPDVSADDLALFPADWTVFANDPSFAYFAGAIDLPAVSYTTGYSNGGASILVERFDATAERLNAGMLEASPYVQVEVEGLPVGATAYDWEDVDRAIVIDDFIISAYFDDDGSAMALLNERANAIANR